MSAAYNTTRRGNISKTGCLCGWSRIKKKKVFNGCPIHKKPSAARTSQETRP